MIPHLALSFLLPSENEVPKHTATPATGYLPSSASPNDSRPLDKFPPKP